MKRILINVVLLVVLVAGSWWLLQRAAIQPLREMFRSKPIVVDESPLLVQNIRELAQLMTIEYYDEVVADSSRGAALLPFPPYIIPARQSLVLVVKGRLLAGIDLQQLDTSHIRIYNDTISIVLPKAEVLEVEVNPSGIETFSEKGEWSQRAVAALTAKARDQMLRNAAAQGVLRRADEKGKQLVEQLLLYAGYKNVVVITPDLD
ncbi:DUF4230 domain-containing protein [Paracnuella aquatica]|uniref:DUF4230 domain-containing protein n=1 Tax=Paracnuella aquatica TaxID=2268757 RepID=UPI000DEF35F7|nr:DUF4230 domain-containing protein [Paracnuella aquatica]RPD50766.1 DUF4230 domain-containing protein [Paracnuella aquatica]